MRSCAKKRWLEIPANCWPCAGCAGAYLAHTSRWIAVFTLAVFDELAADDDTAVERDGVTVVVDPMSYQYLAGSEVDYVEGLEGSRFVINDPNASTTCGCGSSFSI